jgi:hypothetical protein
MFDIDKFDNRVGALGVAVEALANAATATLDLSDYKEARFVAASESSTGVIALTAANTFTTQINRTTGIITFTNASGAAFTGTYYIVGIV